MDWLKEIPDWLGSSIMGAMGWVIITIWSGITAFLGAVIKAGYDAWKRHRLPFRRDKEQFEALTTKEDAQIVRFFKENNNPFIANNAFDALISYEERISDPYWPDHQNRKLKSHKKSLEVAVGNLSTFLARSTQPSNNGGGAVLPEDKEGKKVYFTLCNEFVSVFVAYRDYGTKIFSIKISKEPQGG